MLLRSSCALCALFFCIGVWSQPVQEETIEAVYTSLRVTLLPERPPQVGPLVFRWLPLKIDPGSRDKYRAQLEDPTLSYGPTSLTADEVTIDTESRTIVARGGVFVEDPIGVLFAEELFYDYLRASGHARSVFGNAQGAYVRAEELLLRRGEWIAKRGELTTCSEVPPHYAVRFDMVAIRPGSRAKAYKASLSAFGARIVYLPWLVVPLTRRTNQVAAPTIGYNSRQGWAFSWRNEFQLAERTSFVTETGTFQRALPEWRGTLAYSFQDLRAPGAIGTPSTEEGERFTGSYIDNVAVESPQWEERRLRAPRFVVFFENSTNLPTAARREPDVVISKNWELGSQWSVERGRVYGNLSVRHGEVREKPGSLRTSRSAFQGVLAGSAVPLGFGTQLRLRLDGGYYTYDGRQQYGWFRPAAVVVFEPDPRLRLAFSYLRTYEAGDPLLVLDQPRELRAVHGRFDLTLGKTHLSFLAKYDLDKRNLYDIEIALRQTTHCIEPQLVYRRDPGVLRIGVRIPTVDLLESLVRNRFGR